MHARKIVNRFILWILYLLSLLILIIDLRYYGEENKLFYVLCNCCLVFRLLGCWFFPWIIHVFGLLYLIYYYVTLKWFFINTFNALVCCVPVIIQLVLALHLVLFRPGRSKSQRACRVGVHALNGLILIIVYYWMVCFLINNSDLQCLLEMLYMLLFLFMILTPQFMTHGQAVVQAALERTRHSRPGATAVSWDRKMENESAGKSPRGSTRGRARGSAQRSRRGRTRESQVSQA